jgi:Dna[CI] antecedent, DciA
MAKRLGNDSPISDILKEIITKNKLQFGMDEIDVKEAWKNLMGNGVNSYTKNVAFKNSKLYVELTSSVLREELSLGKSKILKIINDDLGREVVLDLIFR